mmetsp:Transcript_1654/g.5755  ORF Transcript_1654/g.5755 Transcript_1654/m.5755 type:complete len:1922 (-) Transcript_1654:50-5815(-)|eukprot:CAMPEP_0117447046 /NCGR_PEP_ID=MMETSP0759-20121206/6664_1 /TAXON_ID=63605 /ORGANISM="Percolomonas cosmopolitus, Strain WS" /LENGTH=1921 /DNA_ID=CAMNT_0005239351 /DNA_START=57 /DNA_END=5822 /DNA_ORIENTATION=+
MGNICQPLHRLDDQDDQARDLSAFPNYDQHRNSLIEFNIPVHQYKSGEMDARSNNSSMPVLPGTPPMMRSSSWLWDNADKKARRSSITTTVNGRTSANDMPQSNTAKRSQRMMKSTSLTSILSGASGGGTVDSSLNGAATSLYSAAAAANGHALQRHLVKQNSCDTQVSISSSNSATTRRRGLSNLENPIKLKKRISRSNLHFSISPNSSPNMHPSHFPKTSNSGGGVTYYDDSASLQKYLMFRSFLPNTNSIPRQMPDLTSVKDVATLMIRIDGLDNLMRFCINMMEQETARQHAETPRKDRKEKESRGDSRTFAHNGSAAQKRLLGADSRNSTPSNTTPTADRQHTSDETTDSSQNPASIFFHDTLSQYIQRIVRIVIAEHGGIVEKITGDEIICIFRPLEEEISAPGQSVGIHGSPHVFSKPHRYAPSHSDNVANPSKQALIKLTESCRRAAQCGYFLQQKQGKFEVDTRKYSNNSDDMKSLRKNDSIKLSLRCAVGSGVSIISTIGGVHSTWSRLTKNDACAQIGPIVERRDDRHMNSSFSHSVDSVDSLNSPQFGTMVFEEDTDTPDSPSNSSDHQQPQKNTPTNLSRFSTDSPMSPLTRNSFIFSSFHSKPKDEISGSCIVSNEVRALIYNSCTCAKIFVPNAPDINYFKIVGIKDWLPLPEQMKEEGTSTRLNPVPEETLRLYVPLEYRELIDAIHRNPAFIFTQSNSSPNLFAEGSSLSAPQQMPPMASLEHAAIMMMRYDYLQPSDEQFVQFQALQEVFCVIQQMIYSEPHSILLSTVHNENGTMIVAAFTDSPEEKEKRRDQNAPNISTLSNNTCAELRAVRVALRIDRLVQATNDARIQLNIGISSGLCFLGALGGSGRRDFVHIGEAVQRAEELAQFYAASGGVSGGAINTTNSTLSNGHQVICDSTIVDATSNRVRFNHLCCNATSHSLRKLHISVKDSYHVHAVQDVHPDANLLVPVNPHQRACFHKETDTIKQALSTFVAHGAYSSLVIQGAQGSGKTELARRLLYLSSELDDAPRVCVLTCLRREKYTPHFLLRLLLLLYVSDMSDTSLDKRKTYLMHLMRMHKESEYEPYLELWNPVFNVDFPATELSKDLSTVNRLKKLHQMIHHFFLSKFLQDTPTVLVVEDLHNIDDDSKQFLLYLQNQKINNLFLCGTQTVSEENAGRSLSELSPACLIQLKPLTQEEMNQMVASMWINDRELFENEPPTVALGDPQQLRLSIDLSQNLYEETEGSPFFIEQFLLMYTEWDCINMVPARVEHADHGTDDLNPSRHDGTPTPHVLQLINLDRMHEVHSVSDCFTLRLQDLPDIASRIIKVSCVICSFNCVVDAEFLSKFVSNSEESDIFEALELLVKRKFLSVYDPFERIYSFSSDFLCTTLYEMMTLDQQRLLHMQIANAREVDKRQVSATNTMYVDEITFHLVHALLKDEEATSQQLDKLVQYIQISIENRNLTREYQRVHELHMLLIEFMNRLEKSTQRDTQLSQAYLQAARSLQVITPSSEVIKQYIRLAIDVCPKSSTDEMFSALESLWFYEYSHGERLWDTWWPLVTKMLRIAKKTQKPLHLVESNKCAVITLFTFNKYDKMDDHTQKLLVAYKRDPNGVNAVVTGQLNRPNSAVQVCCLTARADWFLGRVKHAHIMYYTAREIVSQITHPVTRSLFLIFACYYLFLVRKASHLKQLSEEALQLSEFHDYTLHKYISMCYHAYARFALGYKNEGLAELRQALELHSVYAAVTPQLSLMYISALVERGEPDDWKVAMEWIMRALENTDINNPNSYNFDSELWRLRGHAKKQGKPAGKNVLKYFVKAYDSEKHSSRSPLLEIRALLDIIELCEENLRPSANDTQSTNSTRLDNMWKQKLDKYTSQLRSIRKQVMNEHLTKEMSNSVHLQSFVEPMEVQAMNRVVQGH